jgi:hypothetical protein
MDFSEQRIGADILLALNEAFTEAGLPIFMRVVDSGYSASGHLMVLMERGTPSSALIPVYNDLLLGAVRRIDPAVISVEISEQWRRVKVHLVFLQRYRNSGRGLDLAWREIELGTPIRLKRDSTWLKSTKAL